jgi:hypothetical protein
MIGGLGAGLRFDSFVRWFSSPRSPRVLWVGMAGVVRFCGGGSGDVSLGQKRTHQLYDLEARDVAGEPKRRDCRFKRYEDVGFTRLALA